MATVTGRKRRPVLAATLGLLASVACGADAGAGSPGAGADAVRSGATGPLEAHTPAGIHVTLSLDAAPAEAGPVRLDFILDTPAPNPDDVTVDLVAPLMPAHGIVRFPTRAETDTRFVSDVEIPMEGLWEIYLNLDTGREAASFEIDVVPTQEVYDLRIDASPRGQEAADPTRATSTEVTESRDYGGHGRFPRGSWPSPFHRSNLGGLIMKLAITSLFAVALLFIAVPAAQAQSTDSDEVEISAQVIDLSCFVANDLKGEEMHRECAQVCADEGVPLALLGDDGTIYHPVSKAMPSSGDEMNQMLRPHAERNVTIRGQVIERGGSKGIIISSIQEG